MFGSIHYRTILPAPVVTTALTSIRRRSFQRDPLKDNGTVADPGGYFFSDLSADASKEGTRAGGAS